MKIKCKGWRTNSCTSWETLRTTNSSSKEQEKEKEEIEISTYVEIREKGTSSGKS